MELQRLSIRQTYATTAIETKQAQLSMESPQGQLEIESIPATMEVNTKAAELSVDSSRAWMALGKGNNLEWSHMVLSQMDQVFLLNVSRIVEEGNRLAKFTKQGSSIADMMAQRIQEESNVVYIGEASSLNVDLQYDPAVVNVEWNQQETRLQYTPQRPQTSYQPAVVEVYLKNKNSIQMWVSNYDIFG